MILKAEKDAKQHLADAEHDGDLHFERVQPGYLILGNLPNLETKFQCHERS